MAQTRDKNRGRLEQRILTTSTRGVAQAKWPGLNRFVRLERITTIDGQTTRSVTYAATSLSVDQADASRLLELIRGRWAIESLFWIKDAVMREDHSRIRSGRSAESMSILRNSAINFLRAQKVPNFAAALRENALKVHDLLTKLHLPTF